MAEVTCLLVEIPHRYAWYQRRDQAWLSSLPTVVQSYLDSWQLTLDGPLMHGWTAIVLPVITSDGTPAVLKVQQMDHESAGEPAALRLWSGSGAVLVLRDDPGKATMLLERLDFSRHLSAVPDVMEATEVIASLLVRLNSHPAPAGLRRLADIAAKMIADVPEASTKVSTEEGLLLKRWAAIVAEVNGQAGNQLLHWDLHFDNVLAGDREPWLAIDPKPLAGNSGFELLPALVNRYDDDDIKKRFDLMTEVLGLDRDRAAAWTIARVLQNSLWSIEDGEPTLDPTQLAIAAVFTGH